jgi:flavin-dependent dehydrogenase
MSAADKTAAHLIVGGGLAGSMVGLRLAAADRRVTLLERERGPHHKVCGEFLSPEAQQYLKQAGIDAPALGAQPIRSVRLSSKRRVIETKLPFTALSLSRCVLDEALLNRAAQLGCNIERGAFVESLTNADGLWHAQLRGRESWSAPTVFLANGKHDLHDFERKPAPQADLVGFKLHWRLASSQTEALRGFMDLYLFCDGYGGLSLVEGDVANLCLVVRRSTLRGKGGWPELLAAIQNENAHIAQRLSGASPLWERPLAVSPIPYGYLAGRPHGLWCVGDQAAVIPSFTGDGMSIAMHSAALAAQMYLAGESADCYHQTLRAQLKPGMRLATALSRTMVTGLGRALAPIELSVLPSTMRWIANSTRIPQKALRHTSVD